MELLSSINRSIRILMAYIANTDIFGIKLDIFAHFIFGVLITVFLKKRKMSWPKIFLILLAVCLVKEIYDSFALTASLGEAIKDTLVTLIYPILSFLISLATLDLADDEDG